MDIEESICFIELKHVENKYLLFYNGTCFSVGKTLFFTLERLQNKHSWQEIVKLLGDYQEVAISIDELKVIVKEKMSSIIDNKAKNGHSYVYGQITIINGDYLTKITKFFKFLFKGAILKVLTTISFILTISYFVFFFNSIKIAPLASLDLKKMGLSVIIAYFCSILIMILHEIGHATASANYNIKSEKIGFGFYLIFPVFFTDVSKIWLLQRKDRMIVNIGGIYFQLLVNALLVIGKFTLPSHSVLSSVIDLMLLSNSLIILNCLNPFLRNDGYWLYSDYFDIPNLMEKSLTYPVKYIKEIFVYGKLKINLKSAPEFPVLFYGLLNYVVIVMITIFILSNLRINTIKLDRIFIHNGGFVSDFFKSNNILDVMKIFFSYFITAVYLYKTSRYLKKGFNNYTTKLRV